MAGDSQHMACNRAVVYSCYFEAMTPVPLMAHLDWDSVEHAIQAELKGRARNRPPSALFRWWARRPYELVGALLDAAQERSRGPLTVSDPFSGGCTVALEASLRGCHTYAQDLNPWPLIGMDVALGGESPEAIERAGAQVLSRLRADCTDYRGSCSSHETSELLVAFWVRRLICPACSSDCYSYPYGLVTLASRARQETDGYFGCTACGEVTRHPINSSMKRCRNCSSELHPADGPLMRNRELTCPHCLIKFKSFDYPDYNWKLSLVQRKCIGDRGSYSVHFDYPSESDMPSEEPLTAPEPLLRPIQDGMETKILKRAGYRTWADLYPPRQMRALLRAAELASEIGNDAVRRHLLLAICGAAEMPGYLVRWDRYYPKAFGATDNHRFAPVGLAAELNPLATQGRGTLARRLVLAREAVSWRSDATGEGRGELGPIEFHVGSSIQQPIASNTVDLILTDPPYYGDIQYSELSTLLRAWAESVGLMDGESQVDPSEEVTVNRSLHLGSSHYGDTLEKVLSECARTLQFHGSLIMTFNNRDLSAWCALGTALRNSGLWVHAIAPVVSESKNDHSKKARYSFTRDLIIECRLDRCELAYVRNSDTSPEALELVAAGQVIASHTWISEAEARRMYLALLDHNPRWINLKTNVERTKDAA